MKLCVPVHFLTTYVSIKNKFNLISKECFWITKGDGLIPDFFGHKKEYFLCPVRNVMQIFYQFDIKLVVHSRLESGRGKRGLTTDYSTRSTAIYDGALEAFGGFGGLYDIRRIGKETALFGCRWNWLRSLSSCQPT